MSASSPDVPPAYVARRGGGGPCLRANCSFATWTPKAAATPVTPVTPPQWWTSLTTRRLASLTGWTCGLAFRQKLQRKHRLAHPPRRQAGGVTMTITDPCRQDGGATTAQYHRPRPPSVTLCHASNGQTTRVTSTMAEAGKSLSSNAKDHGHCASSSTVTTRMNGDATLLSFASSTRTIRVPR